MAITHKRQDDLESMFANFAKFSKKSLVNPRKKKRKVRIKTIRKRLIKFYGHFYSLTSKCLTMVCDFYLDYHWGLAFCFTWNDFYLVSSRFTWHLIWCDVTFLRINSYEFSLEPSLGLFFLLVNVGLFLSSRAF